MKTRAPSKIFAVAAIALFTACSSSGSDTSTDATSVSDNELRKKDPCSACSTDCLTCTESPGCGWDSRNNACRSGDVYGPLSHVGGLRSADWRIGSLFCKDILAAPEVDAKCEATSCMTCAATTNCGWKQSNGHGKCLPGGTGGPWNVSMSGNDNWYWDTSDCQLNYTLGKVPPGPRCKGNGPAGGGYPSSGPSGGSGAGTSDDYVCDVSVVFPPGSTQSSSNFQDYGCAPPSAEQSTTYDEQCDHRYLPFGASSCTVTNCRATGVPYVCPCSGPSDPRSYCH